MKNRIGIVFFTALLSICCVAHAANDKFKPISKNEVSNAFTDKTITTIAWAMLNNHLIQNSLTAYFASNGKIIGHFATAPEGNIPQNDEGTWYVNDNGELCISWNNWFQGKEMCTMVYNLKNSYLFLSKEGSFHTLVLNENIKPGNQLNMMMPAPSTAPMTAPAKTPAASEILMN